jgi:hypothetical protein
MTKEELKNKYESLTEEDRTAVDANLEKSELSLDDLNQVSGGFILDSVGTDSEGEETSPELITIRPAEMVDHIISTGICPICAREVPKNMNDATTHIGSVHKFPGRLYKKFL